MKIAYVASEVFPFVKTGGMADVTGSLPRYIREEEVDIITILPLYEQIDIKKHRLVSSGIRLSVRLMEHEYPFEVYECVRHGVKHYFLHNEFLFSRKEIYGSYADNYLRFGVFSYAVIDLMQHLNFHPDIYHLNDWQSALIAFLLKQVHHHPAKVILTIHNMAYQGVFNKNAINHLGIGWEHFTIDGVEFFDHINFLKAGILFSDHITVVSPAYAEEIKQQPYGNGLEQFAQIHERKITGILNGIDTDEWNPNKDNRLYKNFTLEEYKDRKENKKTLLKELGLKEKEKPLFVFIGRLVKQKGLDFFIHTFEFLQELEINLVMIGEGDAEYMKFFDQIQGKYDNVYIFQGYDEKLSRRLYASADFLLMPSLFEPCGLNQMIAMRYGAVPIVRKTGGLKDTVCDYKSYSKESQAEGKGQGIVFSKKETSSFLLAIMRAISLYANTKKFNKIVKHNMELDFSWQISAKAYLDIYHNLTSKGGDNGN